MARKNRNIGIYVLIITTISFVIIFLCVHFFLSRYIKTEAAKSIESCETFLRSRTDDAYMEYIEGDNLFRSSYIELSYMNMTLARTHYSVDTLVLEWCENNDSKTDKIYLVSLRDRLCYIYQMEVSDESKYVIYTDVSSAKRMSRIVETILVIVMVLCDIAATTLGFKVGSRIREEHDKQKRFFENASHELKTPLMSIQGFSEGLERGIIKDQTSAYRTIQKEVGKMSLMVDDILLLSKYDREVINYSFEEISIKELMGDVLDTFYMEIQNRGLRVDVNIEDRFVYVDINQMVRALSNIISNAVRYARTTISISYSNNQMIIWNDGAQLSQEDIDKMFDRFYMGQGGSTGIGLSLSKEIIEKHGFSLSAGNYGQGVCFVIRLG